MWLKVTTAAPGLTKAKRDKITKVWNVLLNTSTCLIHSISEGPYSFLASQGIKYILAGSDAETLIPLTLENKVPHLHRFNNGG
ncbi:hypothetical protein PoB_003699200 [Plakobranchus ocellatus]|uniref:Uncharacterized protein n=1 Tax=Plakobranchus ocellatus TaxID=259542 RepID=A0AAV4AU75_9GAST|nr:hypothetical protein PoB_003699200 [Plakobranchus ocellatus]